MSKKVGKSFPDPLGHAWVTLWKRQFTLKTRISAVLAGILGIWKCAGTARTNRETTCVAPVNFFKKCWVADLSFLLPVWPFCGFGRGVWIHRPSTRWPFWKRHWVNPSVKLQIPKCSLLSTTHSTETTSGIRRCQKRWENAQWPSILWKFSRNI